MSDKVNVLRVYHDKHGNPLRLELNGVTLPVVGGWRVDVARWGKSGVTTTTLTLAVDAIENVIDIQHGQHGDASESPRHDGGARVVDAAMPFGLPTPDEE